MIPSKVKALFDFVDFLSTNKETFSDSNEIYSERVKIARKMDGLSSENNIRKQIEFENTQKELDAKTNTIKQLIVEPIKKKALELGIRDFELSSLWNMNIDVIPNKNDRKGFEIEDSGIINVYKIKYRDFRQSTRLFNCQEGCFFSDLDEILNLLFDYFPEEKEPNEQIESDFANFEQLHYQDKLKLFDKHGIRRLLLTVSSIPDGLQNLDYEMMYKIMESDSYDNYTFLDVFPKNKEEKGLFFVWVMDKCNFINYDSLIGIFKFGFDKANDKIIFSKEELSRYQTVLETANEVCQMGQKDYQYGKGLLHSLFPYIEEKRFSDKSFLRIDVLVKCCESYRNGYFLAKFSKWLRDNEAQLSKGQFPLQSESTANENTKNNSPEYPNSFEELFFNPNDAAVCLDILRELQPPVIDASNNYKGKNKGVFPLWIEILQMHKPIALIKPFPDMVYRDLLNEKVKGLKLSKDASEFRKPYNSLKKKGKDLDIKTILSQFSQDGRLGK